MSDLRIPVLLSMQRALVGEVTPEMRAVAVQWSPERIAIRVYTHGEPPAAVREDFDASVVSQVVADFPCPDGGDPAVEYEFVRCDAPTRLPDWGHLVFARSDSGKWEAC
jgi:hypothetical protein